ncbi:MAG: tRNA pseudouridine(13) synthase TruD [Candidatus Woesearchaeota archaeon]
MHQIKQKPEDFVVEEIPSIAPLDSGKFAYFWLKKTNLNTMQAIDYIAHDIGISPNFINFAGTKDKNAITTQLISVKGKDKPSIERLKIKNISLTFYGYGSESLHLGDLLGNKFTIRVVDMSPAEMLKLDRFSKLKEHRAVNYFGEQRFSKNNAEVGKLIIKGDIKSAATILMETSIYGEKMRAHLAVQPNDYVTAIKILPKKLLRLYVNSYQSLLWNMTVKRYIKTLNPKDNPSIPMIGFGMEIEYEELNTIINEIMKSENLTLRDFINKKLPDLSAEGILRDMFVEIADFKIIEQNENSAVVSFTLPKGCYATEVIKQIFE